MFNCSNYLLLKRRYDVWNYYQNHCESAPTPTVSTLYVIIFETGTVMKTGVIQDLTSINKS